MKFAVVHDLPGRIRLRCGQYAFTEDESFSLQEVLEKEIFVQRAKASHLTGSILIYYNEGERQSVLDTVAKISPRNLPPVMCPRDYESARLDNDFQNRLIGKVLWHVVRRLYLLAFLWVFEQRCKKFGAWPYRCGGIRCRGNWGIALSAQFQNRWFHYVFAFHL